jgi:hypothetical protein
MQYLSITQAAQRLPGRPHRNSVRRWMGQGCYGIKLRSVRFGGKRLTTEIWCDEFTEAVTARTGRQLSEHHQAEAKLDQLGVC